MVTPRFNEGRLSERFANAIANSRDERIQSFYGTDLDSTAIMEEAKRLASQILGGAKDVVSSTSVAPAQEQLDRLFTRPDDEATQALRRNAMQVIDETIAERIVVMQATAEDRLLPLILAGRRAAIDWRTADYLRRLSECYLFGLDEQCVIMCRAALEAAFLDAVPDSDCVKALGQKARSGPYYLAERIRVGEKIGRLNRTLSHFAREVSRAAADLIHPQRTKRSQLDQKRVNLILLETIHVVESLAETRQK